MNHSTLNSILRIIEKQSPGDNNNQVVDIVNTIGQTSQMKTAIRMDRLARQAEKKKEFQEKMERLEKARRLRDRLLNEL